MADSFEAIVPVDVEPNRTSNQCKEFGAAYKKFYFGYTEPSLANIDTYIQVNFNGDILFFLIPKLVYIYYVVNG